LQDDKRDEGAADAANKSSLDDDDDDDDDQEAQKKKEGGLSNKKKKLERRMKIAELKQICNRPDVVEVLSSFQSSHPAATNLLAHLQILTLPVTFVSSLLGLGCNCFRSKIARISQGLQKYSTCT
jgi:splicing factor 3B subunit 2